MASPRRAGGCLKTAFGVNFLNFGVENCVFNAKIGNIMPGYRSLCFTQRRREGGRRRECGTNPSASSAHLCVYARNRNSLHSCIVFCGFQPKPSPPLGRKRHSHETRIWGQLCQLRKVFRHPLSTPLARRNRARAARQERCFETRDVGQLCQLRRRLASPECFTQRHRVDGRRSENGKRLCVSASSAISV
jgi:hypothetical protein